MISFTQIFEVAGGLGIFFYGMKLMSEAIQRLAGTRLRKSLNMMTRNRFVGILTGFLVTGIIQSSSATTVMIISFVNAGLVTLTESIGVIMGANLGTTVTIWIVSLLGFKFSITSLALPIIAVGIPLIFSRKSKWNSTGEMLIGFGLLFLGLSFMKQGMPDIKNNPEMLKFLAQFSGMGFASFFIFIMVGTVVAAVIQSSSAVGAITITMAFQGWIDFPSAAAIMLGGNVGTTITAYLASMGSNVHGKRTARAHFLFNIIGVAWVLVLYLPITKLMNLATAGSDMTGTDLTVYISVFHTLFNLINIVVLVAFVPQLAKLAKRMVKLKPGEKEGEYRLEYISTGILKTPEMFILEARKEIIKMSIISFNMFQAFLDVFFHPDKKMGETVAKVKEQEDLTDKMKEELTRYLAKVSQEILDEQSAFKVTGMMRIVNEIESIADCCYDLILATQKRYDEDIKLHPLADQELKDFSESVLEFMQFNIENLLNARLSEEDLKKAVEFEKENDKTRNALRETSVKRISETGLVQPEILFMEIIKNFERIGDYSLNISQALARVVVG
ncbi:MAG: Na/Pi cotransporter family protein [Proteobacteria bacterium]|nr:Na/Pi cotransporter family protein [Pseudomonadota bacterium]